MSSTYSYLQSYFRRSQRVSMFEFYFSFFLHFIYCFIVEELFRPTIAMFRTNRAKSAEGGKRYKIQVISSEEEEKLSVLPHLELSKENLKSPFRSARSLSTKPIDARSSPMEPQQKVSTSLPNDADHDCSICYMPTTKFVASRSPQTHDPDADTEFAAQLPCGHIFGHICLLRWLSSTSQHNANSNSQSRDSTPTCPICRFSLRHSVCGHHVFPTLPEAAPPPLPQTLQPGEYVMINGVRTSQWVEKREPLAGSCMSCRIDGIDGDEGILAKRLKDISAALAARKAARESVKMVSGDFTLQPRFREKEKGADWSSMMESLWAGCQTKAGRVLRRSKW